ncbi:membrane ATPase/protein kinase [Georgfuchsia toluolica]|uniref:Membrane ATPase/protein kinase n=1 Tax=Georgfuchsia toluolica TaxID=424218 RepID=A0A916N939_9PROT|nr:methylmalonyl Co-A mutase-associated GTPase MeaB [Georgfuchsia toluolica]CAG4884037.1 membrane ATPase/protein kinase [Georgfuchsia toluolica]
MTTTALGEQDAALVKGVLAHERRALAKTITLLESTRADHRERGRQVLEALLPHSGKSIRIGISGVPGVGKSTFIEALGMLLIGRGHRVAVLAIDPSSSISGGSILGDKTRMEQLSMRDEAFIRPSPSAGSLGGVADKTREAMLACEAAGFDIVIVETVGVGQSETEVAGMTDVFVLLQLPNAGDDLQAIKKGIVELADVVVFNKADIDLRATEMAVAQMQSALALLHPATQHWKVPVLKISATRGDGIDLFWQTIDGYRQSMESHGAIAARRRQQALAWMWHLIESGLHQRFNDNPGVKHALPALAQAVQAGTITPSAAARQLLNY